MPFPAGGGTDLVVRALQPHLHSKGVNAQPGSGAALRAAVAHDIPYWGRIAKSVGATVD